MDVERLNKELVKESLLNYVVHFEELDSTNKYAKENNLPPDGIVLTSFQKEGKGRFGRKWIAASDEDLTFSLVKKFNISVDNIHLVNFYTSYILSETLKSILSSHNNIHVHLKWPNDVLLNKKKICGILLEISGLHEDEKNFIIGIGLNVNKTEIPDNISHKASSLSNETQARHCIEDILIEFIGNFYRNLHLINTRGELMTAWKKNSELIGKKVKFLVVADSHEEEAEILDIEEDGSLKVKLANGEVKNFYSGEITFVY
ncbi:MAG: biotin--[acetyl-CoA-carboxylase] ligase [Ignavibacteria bacterium]|nr:biotin--[acetyl-CoA-carboxylase] ligase [Ignavibacteria bacterium]